MTSLKAQARQCGDIPHRNIVAQLAVATGLTINIALGQRAGQRIRPGLANIEKAIRVGIATRQRHCRHHEHHQDLRPGQAEHRI